nr:immunoglobulin light chain junction region [Macaca mulatta]MOW15893.1 immunoglobulin light chain junction region [Macaca mulatta]
DYYCQSYDSSLNIWVF